MLDAYIIDAIRKQEEERERDFARRRIWLELPVPQPMMPPHDRADEEEEERGPVVIPFSPDIRDVEDDAA